jgi:hypothetical protein
MRPDDHRNHPELRHVSSLDFFDPYLEMAHKVIVPQKKIMSPSFLNSGTFIVIGHRSPRVMSWGTCVGRSVLLLGHIYICHASSALAGT